MRQLILYGLLLAMLLPSISPWGTIAYYQLNKEYIAKNLCENRNRPELHCDGKCYLAKKLKAQQDKQDQETIERVRNVPMLTLFCADRFSFDFSPLTQLAARSVPSWPYLLGAYSAPLTAVFQPPAC